MQIKEHVAHVFVWAQVDISNVLEGHRSSIAIFSLCGQNHQEAASSLGALRTKGVSNTSV